MLQAILNGKGRRLPNWVKPGDSLRNVFAQSEDILTATVFERLAYLEGANFWNVLSGTFRSPLIPERRVAELASIEFWPTWGQAGELLGKSVEPDVVLRFEVGDPTQTVTFIVECKHRDFQHADQWASEWIAHDAEMSEFHETGRVVFLALGGLPGNARELAASLAKSAQRKFGISMQVAAADWLDLLKAVDQLNRSKSEVARIANDITDALSLHGYRRTRSFSTLHAVSSRKTLHAAPSTALRWHALAPARG